MLSWEPTTFWWCFNALRGHLSGTHSLNTCGCYFLTMAGYDASALAVGINVDIERTDGKRN